MTARCGNTSTECPTRPTHVLSATAASEQTSKVAITAFARFSDVAADTPRNLRRSVWPVVTRRDAPGARRFLATPHRDSSVCPRSESTSAHAAGEERSLEVLIGHAFRWVDRPLTPSLRCYSPVLSDHPLPGQTPFRAENLGPVSLEAAAPGGWLNFWRTNIFRRRGLAAAASSSDVIQDARPRQRSQMKGIRYGLAMIAQPEWRR